MTADALDPLLMGAFEALTPPPAVAPLPAR